MAIRWLGRRTHEKTCVAVLVDVLVLFVGTVERLLSGARLQGERSLRLLYQGAKEPGEVLGAGCALPGAVHDDAVLRSAEFLGQAMDLR